MKKRKSLLNGALGVSVLVAMVAACVIFVGSAQATTTSSVSFGGAESSTGSDPIKTSTYTGTGSSENGAQITVVTGSPNDYLALYQIINVTYNESANSITEAFTSDFQTFLSSEAYSSTSLGSSLTYGTLTIETYNSSLDSASDEMNQLLGDYAAYVRANTSTVTPTDTAVTADTDTTASDEQDCTAVFGSDSSDTIPMGQYIIVGMGQTQSSTTEGLSHYGAGTYIYETMTATVFPYTSDDVYYTNTRYNLIMKVSRPSITKEVTAIAGEDPDSYNSATTGDTISFEVTLDVPTYPDSAANTTFFFCENLDDGFTLDTDSIKVYAGSSSASGTELTAKASSDAESGEYYVDSTAASTNSADLQIDFDYALLASTDNSTGAAVSSIVITYTATLNNDGDDITMGLDDDDNGQNVSTAYLYYTNSPFNGSTTTTVSEDSSGYTTSGMAARSVELYVSTFGIRIAKIASGSSDPLANATFALYSDEDLTTAVTDSDGDAISITTDSNGYAAISGLALGTYYLEETVAPSGYRAADTTSITITSSNTTGTTYLISVNRYSTSQTTANQSQATDSSGSLLYLPSGSSISTTPVTSTDADYDSGTYVAAYLVDTEDSYVSASSDDSTTVTGYTDATTITDTVGNELPTTGGMGPAVYFIVGGLIAAASGSALIMRNRKKSR